jgi:catechol 2,3-dioxygenase
MEGTGMAELGHIVLYVKDLKRSVAFYTSIVGLDLVSTVFNGRAAALTGGRTHHELLLIEVGDAPPPPAGHRLGLYHIGWKIGEHLDALRAKLQQIEQQQVVLDGMSDHTVSQSLYVRDPDGNEIELYVDNPEIDWRHSHDWLKQPVKPLHL